MLIQHDDSKATGRKALALIVIYAAFWLFMIMS